MEKLHLIADVVKRKMEPGKKNENFHQSTEEEMKSVTAEQSDSLVFIACYPLRNSGLIALRLRASMLVCGVSRNFGFPDHR